MPTQTKQLVKMDDCQLSNPPIRHKHRQVDSPMATNTNMVGSTIAVQPPAQAQRNQTLYPPLLAKQSVHVEPGAQYFATAVLLNAAGAIVEGLEGTKAATGFQLDDSSPGGASTMVYGFPNLRISALGAFKIRLDVYQISALDMDSGAALMEQLIANVIHVVDDEVPPQPPSSHEEALINRARDVGVPIPSP